MKCSRKIDIKSFPSSFRTTIIFPVIYLATNLLLFLKFGQRLFQNDWILFATAPINFGENFPDGYPTSLQQAWNVGIVNAGNFWYPWLIIFVAELSEFLLKSRYSVFRIYVLAMIASWLYSPVGFLVPSVNEPIKGTSISAFSLFVYYWLAKAPVLVFLNRRKKEKPSSKFVTWFFAFWFPCILIGLFLIYPGYIGQMNHYLGLVIFVALFALQYSLGRWKRYDDSGTD